MTTGVSVVIAASARDEVVNSVVDSVLTSVSMPCEVVIVVERGEGSPSPDLVEHAAREPRLRLVVRSDQGGSGAALREVIDLVQHPVAVVVSADGSDDPRQIDALAQLVDRGVVVAAASRHCRSGQLVGGPRLHGLLSRGAGRSLSALARVGTQDATNSFKAYSTRFVQEIGIDSHRECEVGLELTAKARRLRKPVAEVPTIWLRQTCAGRRPSLVADLPRYLRWYRFAFGPKLDHVQVARAARDIAERNARLNRWDGVH